MMARRRASAIRASRMVVRLAIAKGKPLSFSGHGNAVSIVLATSYKRVLNRLSPHFEMLPVQSTSPD